MTLQEYTASAHNFEECMKCTVCTAYCPVVPVRPSYPGPKQAGPDAERMRLKDPYFYDESLKYCLNCKRCEVACPSGVKVADIIQAARLRFGGRPKLRDRILASTDLMGMLAHPIAPVVNTLTKLGITKAVLDGIMKIDRHRSFPNYSFTGFEEWFANEAHASQAQFRRQVAYFHGCYVNYNFPDLGKDFVKVMNALGIGVQLLDGEKCCGVAMIANNMKKSALNNARHNVAALGKAVEAGLRVLTTSSTCTFTMRDEYPELLGVDNSAVRDSLTLATKYLCEQLENGTVELKFKKNLKLKVAYHTPCHLEKLGWGVFSYRLLQQIPGLELVKLDSNCCGIAGTYGFKKENYATSQAIGAPLFAQIREVAPDYVACDCETCKWQIEMSAGVRVLNPISLLAMALED